MIKYRGHEIFLINTLGKWYGLVHKDGVKIYETMGYTQRDFAKFIAQDVINSSLVWES
jgi:hypothetical protein